jgi:hypothetical protein
MARYLQVILDQILGALDNLVVLLLLRQTVEVPWSQRPAARDLEFPLLLSWIPGVIKPLYGYR